MASFFEQYDNIWAYEPVPDNYKILYRNVERFQSVYPFNFALSDTTGIIHISPKRDNMGASEVHPEGSLVSWGARLDDIFFPHKTNITLIKLDVEWHEPQVLSGAEKVIKRDKPLILIEDSNKEYAKLLPDYECIMAWEGERTYLYQWRR
jgi:FkbM family methyltransferase